MGNRDGLLYPDEKRNWRLRNQIRDLTFGGPETFLSKKPIAFTAKGGLVFTVGMAALLVLALCKL